MNKSLNYVIAVCITSLMLVWPVMFTIALRYGLAGLLCLSTFVWWHKNYRDINPLFKQPPVLLASSLLALLSLWFVIQAIWIVPEADWVWKELRGQWLKDLLFWVLGISLGVGALRQRTNGNNLWLLAMVFGLVGIVVTTAVQGIVVWIDTRQMPTFFNGITGSRTMASFVTNMLLAFLVGDLLTRHVGTSFLPWKKSITVVLIITCMLNALFIATRHGWLGIGMLAFSGVVIHYIKGWRRLGRKALWFLPALIVGLGVSGMISWKADSRWNTLKETLPIAWDIDTHKAWLDHEKYPWPTLANGQTVDSSNYERPAWIHVGLRIIAERPLGTGFSRHAFGHEIARLYPDGESSSGKHAHSSMIDLAIGGGIPAVVLWSVFIVALVCYGGSAFFRYGSGAGLVLVFLTSGFFGRSLLDSVMRDHSMEQFMFIVAFLLPIVSWDLHQGKAARLEKLSG